MSAVPVTSLEYPKTLILLPQRFLYPQNEINTNLNVPNSIPNVFTKTPANK
jgi:hypothetical protein